MGIFSASLGKGWLWGRGGDSNSVDLPSAPEWWSDPNLDWSQNTLKGQSDYLLNGLTQDGGRLSGLLGDTVSLNPDITRLAMTRLQASMEPYMRDSRQGILNTLEANNQLTGSTTASSLGNLEADYLSALTAAGAEASIADINRALQNRVGLYGTGLNTTQAVGSAALQNQQMRNNFALQNYENQLAEILGEQPAQTGGFGGFLQGAAGGAIAGGSMFGGPGAVFGGLLGGFSGFAGSPGTGGQYLSSGALLAGLKGFGKKTVTSSGTGNLGESIELTQYSSPFNYSNTLSNSGLVWR